MALVLTGAFPHRGVRVCAHRIGLVVRRDRNAYGCKVDEGSAHPCIINGHDYGELLYSLGVMGWFMLVTIPGALVAFVSSRNCFHYIQCLSGNRQHAAAAV